MIRKKFKQFCLYALLVCGVVGCSSLDSKETTEKVASEEELYNQGQKKLESQSYKAAIEAFQELERTYPYSKWATKAQVMSAYASYLDEEYDDALITLDRFIRLHPGNAQVSYAYYLKALCYYDQISDISRDQGYTQYAEDALQEVVARFPHSEYARDAQIKLDLVRDHLAGKEVDVGRFYLKQGNHIGAINRFKRVIQKYDTTAHVPEALHRLVEAYYALGLLSEANKYAAVLGHNYPGSRWYEYSYALLQQEEQAILPETKNKSWLGLGRISLFGSAEEEETDSLESSEALEPPAVEQ